LAGHRLRLHPARRVLRHMDVPPYRDRAACPGEDPEPRICGCRDLRRRSRFVLTGRGVDAVSGEPVAPAVYRRLLRPRDGGTYRPALSPWLRTGAEDPARCRPN